MGQTIHPRCRGCPAGCCRYFCLRLAEPETYEELDEARWFLTHGGVTVLIDHDGEWWLRVDSRCKWLVGRGRSWRCRQHARRPLPCRRLSPERCEQALGRAVPLAEFTSSDELEAYAREALGERFELARRHLEELADREAQAADRGPKPRKPRKRAAK